MEPFEPSFYGIEAISSRALEPPLCKQKKLPDYEEYGNMIKGHSVRVTQAAVNEFHCECLLYVSTDSTNL
jgi:hypothetical protein